MSHILCYHAIGTSNRDLVWDIRTSHMTGSGVPHILVTSPSFRNVYITLTQNSPAWPKRTQIPTAILSFVKAICSPHRQITKHFTQLLPYSCRFPVRWTPLPPNNLLRVTHSQPYFTFVREILVLGGRVRPRLGRFKKERKSLFAWGLPHNYVVLF